MVKIGQTNLNAEIVGFGEVMFLEEADRFGLPVVFEMNLSKLQEKGGRLAHDPLLNIKVGQFFEGADLFGSKFGDALVDSDGLGEKTVANKNLGETLEIIDGLKGLPLADIEL